METLQKPMLQGVVCEQWVRCGKPNCRCNEGQKHGPYFYSFWWDGDRQRKEYVKRKDVAQVAAQCKARQTWDRAVTDSIDFWRALSKKLREIESQ